MKTVPFQNLSHYYGEYNTCPDCAENALTEYKVCLSCLEFHDEYEEYESEVDVERHLAILHDKDEFITKMLRRIREDLSGLEGQALQDAMAEIQDASKFVIRAFRGC